MAGIFVSYRRDDSREIAAALQCDDVRVIPLLVSGAEMPRASWVMKIPPESSDARWDISSLEVCGAQK